MYSVLHLSRMVTEESLDIGRTPLSYKPEMQTTKKKLSGNKSSVSTRK